MYASILKATSTNPRSEAAKKAWLSRQRQSSSAPSKAAPVRGTMDTAATPRKSKMTIQQAQARLADYGMKLGKGRADLKNKQVVYEVTAQDGKTREIPAKNILDWLSGRRKSML